MSKLRLSGVEWESIVDGPGIRCAVFAQGCPHCCAGCHNPQTWSFTGGYEAEPDSIIERMRGNPLLRGITLTGGEPFCQPEAMAELARKARAAGYDVVAYSGYTFEELLAMSRSVAAVNALLSEIDLLIDGPFIQEQRGLELPFRGSANQRIISVSQSLADGSAYVAG